MITITIIIENPHFTVTTGYKCQALIPNTHSIFIRFTEMDGLFYSGVDIQVLFAIHEHIKRDRELPSRGRCDATFVFITGDAGTGKTRLQDSFRYLDNIRPIYTGSTNIAGREQNRVLSDNQMYVKDHKSVTTTFRLLLNINPKIHAKALKILFKGQSDRVLRGEFEEAGQFYEELWPAMKNCCKYILTRGNYQENNKFITPQDYHKYRKIVSMRHPEMVDGDVRVLHNATMSHILSVVPRSSVYDYLVFDTMVFDEAGRIPCSWALLNVAMYYYIHEWFDTGMIKPVVVIVGSCTQSSVINDTCLEGCGRTQCEHDRIPLNDYSMITMIVKKCLLYQDGVMVRHNKYNRRMKSGDTERAANLSTLCNCLELGERVPESVMSYIRTHMTVSKEEFYGSNCTHLCVTHEECDECLKALDKKVTKDDMMLAEECMIAKGDVGPDVLYRCSSPAGAMYKSANYLHKTWTKKLMTRPLNYGSKAIFGLVDDSFHRLNNDGGQSKKARIPFEKRQEEEDRGPPERFSCYTNKRVFYKGRPYTTTHSARATLASISGSWEDLLRDLMVLENIYVDSPELILQLINAISTSLRYAFDGDDDFVEEITDRVTDDSTVDDLLHTLYDLRCVLTNAARDRAQRRELSGNDYALNNDDPHFGKDWFKDVVHVVPRDDAPHLTIPKGEIVYVEGRVRKHQRAPVQVRLGKTMVVNLYLMPLKVDQGISSYSDQPVEAIIKLDRMKRNHSGSVAEKVSPEGILLSVDSYTDDFSDDEDDAGPAGGDAGLSARIQINASETDDAPLYGSTTSSSDEFTVLELFPIKLSVVGTVAAHQGMTLNNLTYVKVNRSISAYNFIVMSTRCSSSDDLYFYFADSAKADSDISITPLDDVTAETIKRLMSLSMGFTGTL